MSIYRTFTTTVVDASGNTVSTQSTNLDQTSHTALLAYLASIFIPPANADGTPGTPYTEAQLLGHMTGSVYSGYLIQVESYLKQQAAAQAAAAIPSIVPVSS